MRFAIIFLVLTRLEGVGRELCAEEVVDHGGLAARVGAHEDDQRLPEDLRVAKVPVAQLPVQGGPSGCTLHFVDVKSRWGIHSDSWVGFVLI